MRCRSPVPADRPDAVGELPLASVDVVIVERRTNHEGDGSYPGGLPSRVVATRPGACGKPVSCGKGQRRNEMRETARRG